MLDDYAGASCPVCKEKFKDGDDIVVCPVCGTPYHRACYPGRCVNEHLHGGGAWTPEAARAEEESRYDAAAPLRCAKCGTVNPPGGIFCQICGYRLGEGEPGSSEGPDPIPMSAYTTPYGGVSPDEEIGGASARDLALFVGENSHYFIPRFKALCRGVRTAGWNWPAFLFRGFYFLYRKMYLAGIGLLLAAFLLGVPATLLNISYLTGWQVSAFGLSLLQLSRAAIVCNFLSVMLSLGCAAFFNRFYCARALRTVRREREAFGGDVYDQRYIMALTRRGRTNRPLILGLIGGYVLLSLVLSFVFALRVV